MKRGPPATAPRRKPPHVDVEVRYAARKPWVPRPRAFETWANAVGYRGVDTGILSVIVVGAARSRSLNARYRRKPVPTNVLSFHGAGAAPDGRHYLGELVICAPIVAREALQQGKPAGAHWAHLTVHGILHLLGFDHELDPDARRMAAREIQILDRLGFANPYA